MDTQEFEEMTLQEIANWLDEALLRKDIQRIVAELQPREVRALVSSYYIMQKLRVMLTNKVKSIGSEPTACLGWFAGVYHQLEKKLASILGAYAKRLANEHWPAEWALGLYGIGPILLSGLFTHIDIEKAPTVGKLWRFAGLDPTCPRTERGVKRAYNSELKVLCWKIAHQFKRRSFHDRSVYTRLYAWRKEFETRRNDQGLYREQAEATLRAQPNHAQRAIYKQGKLPPGRIDLRAMRYAVKIFLSHLHEALYAERYGVLPPKPYVLEKHPEFGYIEPPNLDEFPAWARLRRGSNGA